MMKPGPYLFTAIFLAITFFASLSVKAYNRQNSGNTNSIGTSLPINAGIIYSVVAVGIIGATLVTRSRSAKASKIFLIMVISSYKEKWNKVPVAVKKFLLKALTILLLWKIAYLAFLLPTRLLDKPLTYSVGSAAAWVLNVSTHSSDYSTRSEADNVATDNGYTYMPLQKVFFHQRNVVSIEDGCNALELFVLYAGFIICMPAKSSRKTLFIIGGIIAIYIVNVIRCAGIAYIIIYHPRYADFAHHYVFTFVVYGFIIALWLLFSKKLNLVNG